MRTLWLVVPDHVMKETPYFGRLDAFGHCSKLFATEGAAIFAAAQQHKNQGWPVHVLEASVIQIFPAEQEATLEERT